MGKRGRMVPHSQYQHTASAHQALLPQAFPAHQGIRQISSQGICQKLGTLSRYPFSQTKSLQRISYLENKEPALPFIDIIRKKVDSIQ